MKWRHLAQVFGTIVAMSGSSHQIWLGGLLAQLYYQSRLSELSLIATLGFYVVFLSFLMQVNFNYSVNEYFVSHRPLLRKTCVFFSQTFCLTKAYNFCHQVALVAPVDGPMRRQLAIRWTTRKRVGAVWACAQNSRMLPTTLAMSDYVSGHFEGRTILVGLRGPEISSGEGNEPIRKKC